MQTTQQEQKLSDEQYKELLALNKKIKEQLKDLRNKARMIRIRSQNIIDQSDTKKVLKNIIDTL